MAMMEKEGLLVPALLPWSLHSASASLLLRVCITHQLHALSRLALTVMLIMLEVLP